MKNFLFAKSIIAIFILIANTGIAQTSITLNKIDGLENAVYIYRDTVRSADALHGRQFKPNAY